MKRVAVVRGALALTALGVGLVTTSSSARAERIISDLEASKLTFAALTAPPPPVVHHVRHVAVAKSSHRVVLAAAQHGKAHSMVRLVSYHPAHAVSAHSVKRRHRT